ncbi:hypothetical protein E2320_000183, partial [Naja naja]
TCSL